LNVVHAPPPGLEDKKKEALFEKSAQKLFNTPGF